MTILKDFLFTLSNNMERRLKQALLKNLLLFSRVDVLVRRRRCFRGLE